MNSNEFELLDFLSKCYIEFGILDKDGNQVVKVNILNTDNTTSEIPMKVQDVMYFTEYGTATIPGKFIFEKTNVQINKIIDKEISLLIDEIFKGDKTKDFVRNRMYVIALKIRNYLRNYLKIFVKNNNTLGEIFGYDKDQNPYLYDLTKLDKYIDCIVKFKN